MKRVGIFFTVAKKINDTVKSGTLVGNQRKFYGNKQGEVITVTIKKKKSIEKILGKERKFIMGII